MTKLKIVVAFIFICAMLGISQHDTRTVKCTDSTGVFEYTCADGTIVKYTYHGEYVVGKNYVAKFFDFEDSNIANDVIISVRN